MEPNTPGMKSIRLFMGDGHPINGSEPTKGLDAFGAPKIPPNCIGANIDNPVGLLIAFAIFG